MMKYLITILVSAATLLTASCIKNDIPYPLVLLNIEGIEGEGFTLDNINSTDRVVTLKLDETTDIRNVAIDQVTLTESANPSRELIGVFDMRTPIYVTLSLYQDYEWSIVAQQAIDRRFGVEGQIGATTFDVDSRTATAYVGKTTDLSNITVEELRLGPDQNDMTTYSPAVSELSGDFTTFRFVDATCHGVTERWKLYVLITDKSVELKQADAWSRVIWLYGSGIAGEPKMGFRYRKKTETNDAVWLEAPDVDIQGGSFTAALKVDSETTYEVKAYCGEEETEAKPLTTESVRQLPNAGLEDWSKPKKTWFPFLSDNAGNAIDPFWGTGNPGATTLGEDYNITTQVNDPRPGSAGSTSAHLETRWVVLKLAAGNLFTGAYSATRGTDGVVNFGQPFTLRPTAVRLWVKYTQGMIDRLGTGHAGSAPVGVTIKAGDPDQGSIFIALGTWTKEEYGMGKDNAGNDKEGGKPFGTDASPLSIDTRDMKTFFNPKGKDVIAYGEQIIKENIVSWKQITIPIAYRSSGEQPTHLILACAASRYGDYFTGSTASRMWLDDVELIYDEIFEENIQR